MAAKYTVKKGDTLSEIAQSQLGSAKKTDWLAAINGIKNKNRIYVGQILYLDKASASSSTKKEQKKLTNMANVTHFGLQSDTDNTLFAIWKWGKSHTENYMIQWQYYTANKVWFVGTSSTTEDKESTYSIPSNATRVRFRVKPVSKTYKKNKKDTKYWTADWSTWRIFNVNVIPPAKPNAPSGISIDKNLKLTVKLENLDSSIDKVNFEIIKNDKTIVHKSKARDVSGAGFVSYTCKVDSGGSYRVRCQYVSKVGIKSEWSDWSSESVGTIPTTPTEIIELRAVSSTEVYIDWTNVKNATGYTVDYTTNKKYFDSGDSQQKTVDSVVGNADITGLETGHEYFFRVKATNDQGDSGWCPIKSITVGTKPSPPTTWSSTSTVSLGDAVRLYYVHNSEDASNISKAKVSVFVDNVLYEVYNMDFSSLSDEEKNKTHMCTLDTNNEYWSDKDGATITWFVMTAGVLKHSGGDYVYSDPSIERTIKLYESPTLELDITETYGELATRHYKVEDITGDGQRFTQTEDIFETVEFVSDLLHLTENTNRQVRVGMVDGVRVYYCDEEYLPSDGIIEGFPFYIKGTATPNTQKPIGYNISIFSNEKYETVDEVGNVKVVNEGEAVYSKYIDINSELVLEMSPGNIDLENGVSYTITGTVSMDSGLTAESSVEFTVSWAGTTYEPNAEITYDPETYVTHVRPYCEETSHTYYKVTFDNGVFTKTEESIEYVYGEEIDAVTTTGEQVFYGTIDDEMEDYYCEVESVANPEDITLTVYRREFDGTFTELAKDLNNTDNVTFTDPHPALDYARYRIVATSTTTGTVSYYDMPGYPIGEKGVIIQWDEQWSNFDVINEDEMEQPPWSGSLLRLPYNIDVSNSSKPDVSLVEYIGRKHPVGYYGTQLGETMSISVDIDKLDEETLYAIRRLSIWQGDVYVREPSGVGYWANVTVSYNQTHRDPKIPISISVTRVEGGV